MKTLDFTKKRNFVLNAVVYLHKIFNQDFIIQEEFLSFE